MAMKLCRPQRVVHLELHTGDLAQASAFYLRLLRWRAEEIETGRGSYLALDLGGFSGGIVECGTRRPLWLPYVEVDRVHEITERTRQLGASVLLEPREGPVGWRSVVTTPAGGEVAFWQPKTRLGSRGQRVNERDLLEAARRGDAQAFDRLVEPLRTELHAHCYRMLGSVHDSEDALQEALLRAWRGFSDFEGRSSFRSWLYTIATNACLRAIERRPKRVLPIDYGPAADPHDGLAEPLVESVWVDPYPYEALGLRDGFAGPEARYEQRESVELAFTAALQYLPARQRAVLILCDVLGFSSAEVAEVLEMTPAAVYSSLQRAYKIVDERLPEQSQQATLRALGDGALRELAPRSCPRQRSAGPRRVHLG
jgi:RNA polymerase sigma factor (sigma-70 family)